MRHHPSLKYDEQSPRLTLSRGFFDFKLTIIEDAKQARPFRLSRIDHSPSFKQNVHTLSH